MKEHGDEQPWEIQEEVSTRAIEALMANYGDPQQAFMELIDNAVDNRIDRVPLEVRIRVTRGELSVHNVGGNGLTREGLGNFFVWGYSEKTAREIGFYGVGGKAAMGYLGRSMLVVCSPNGSSEEYRVEDPSWESRQEGQWKRFRPEIRRTETEEGYFRVRVTGLKQKVLVSPLIARLGNVYRPLLRDGSVKIYVNGVEVQPLEVRYKDDDPNLVPERFRLGTRFGEDIQMKVGVLADDQKGVRPGLTFCYRGRVIEEGQFPGKVPSPTQLPSMERFYGEGDLDFVPVTTNKVGFNRGSVAYADAVTAIERAIVPKWTDKMKTVKVEHTSPVEKFEEDLARRVKRVLEHVLAETGWITKADLPGESVGRRPPIQRHEPKIPTGRPGGPGPKEGQTAPALEATVSEMKRWGAMAVWEVKQLGASGRRSDVIRVEGRDVLVINSDFPLYQAAKQIGDAALGLQIAETAVLKLCEIASRDRSKEEYLELVERFLREATIVFQARIKEMKEKSPRAKKSA